MTALPWRPIAELPVAPHWERWFLFGGGQAPAIRFFSPPNDTEKVFWPQFSGRWTDGIGEHGRLEDFTHFIEITPP